jgi:GT2 family glycosyltransferase
MIARLEADPRIDLLYPNAVLFGLPRWEGQLFQGVYPSSAPVTFEKLLARECVVFVSVTFKRELVERIGLYDESLRWCEDLDLWLRMAQQGCHLAFTTEPLVRYRKRESSLSADEVRMPRSLIAVYEKVLTNPETTPPQRALIEPILAELRAQVSKAMSKQMISARDYAGAATQLALANAHYRSFKLTLVSAALRIAPGLVARLVSSRQ